MTKLDFTKPITTRDGRKVTIYTHEAPGDWPVHGRIDGVASPTAWEIDGRIIHAIKANNYDLINAPERRKVKVWINVYKNDFAPHHSRQMADKNADRNRIACIEREIEYTVGEGLEEGAKND